MLLSAKIQEQIEGFESMGNPAFAPMLNELREWHRLASLLEGVIGQTLCNYAVVPAKHTFERMIDIAIDINKWHASEVCKLRGWPVDRVRPCASCGAPHPLEAWRG